jgi:hypothetical protein
MRGAVDLCRRYDVEIIWERVLWPAYGNVASFTEETVVDPNYYKEQILTVKEEAAALGVEYTALYLEPYGQMPLREEWVWNPLSNELFQGIMNAIAAATAEVGQVDFVTPCYGWFDNHIYTACKGIGKLKTTTFTHYNVPWKIATEHEYHVFAAFTNTDPLAFPATEKSPMWTPEEILVERQDLWQILLIHPLGNNVPAVAAAIKELYSQPPGDAADLDDDGDVDVRDFLIFCVCYNGTLNPAKPDCENLNADLDGDGDVDGPDFSTFYQCYNGSLMPPRCP